MKTNDSGSQKTYIICAVDRGWKGMRQFALALTEEGYEVALVLREKVPAELLKIISSHQRIRIIPCGKKIFPFRFVWIVLKRIFIHKVEWLVFNRQDRVKKLNWLARFIGAKCLVLEEKGNSYRLLFQGSELDAKEFDLLLVRRI